MSNELIKSMRIVFKQFQELQNDNDGLDTTYLINHLKNLIKLDSSNKELGTNITTTIQNGDDTKLGDCGNQIQNQHQTVLNQISENNKLAVKEADSADGYECKNLMNQFFTLYNQTGKPGFIANVTDKDDMNLINSNPDTKTLVDLAVKFTNHYKCKSIYNGKFYQPLIEFIKKPSLLMNGVSENTKQLKQSGVTFRNEQTFANFRSLKQIAKTVNENEHNTFAKRITEQLAGLKNKNCAVGLDKVKEKAKQE